MIYSSKGDRCYRFVFCGQDVWTPPQLADHKLQVLERVYSEVRMSHPFGPSVSLFLVLYIAHCISYMHLLISGIMAYGSIMAVVRHM